MLTANKKEKLQSKILSVFKEHEILSWAQIYYRLHLPIRRNNWDYVEAFNDLKCSGRLETCINNTYKIHI